MKPEHFVVTESKNMLKKKTNKNTLIEHIKGANWQFELLMLKARAI
jgi:hypothetical protein